MAKKRKNKNTASQPSKQHNPFRALKGFVVSADDDETPQEKAPPVASEAEREVDFSATMKALGVQPMTSDEAGHPLDRKENAATESTPEQSAAGDDRALFLQAMTHLDVQFADHLPEPSPAIVPVTARMKKLRRGRIAPDATLDLHGVLRHEVDDKMRHFLQNAAYQGAEVVLVITGKGLHSAVGEPVVRQAVEDFMRREGTAHVVQWGRAPRRYGGDGALVLFLRTSRQEQ